VCLSHKISQISEATTIAVLRTAITGNDFVVANWWVARGNSPLDGRNQDGGLTGEFATLANSPHDWRRASLARRLVNRPAIHLQVGLANFVGLATRRWPLPLMPGW